LVYGVKARVSDISNDFVESKTVTITVAGKPKSDFKKSIRLMPGKKRLSQRERFA
jgi:hypothetical protein